MIYYLASMPRSGSTLLASLLGQRPDTYVSPTSNLGETLGAVCAAYEQNPATKAGQCTKDELYRTLKAAAEAKYADRKETVIIDKGRQWPQPVIMDTMGKAMKEDIKIIATVRSIAECIASFFVIDGGKDIKKWVKESQLYQHLMFSYQSLKAGYEKYPNQFCLVEYDSLVNVTQGEMNRIADFLGVKREYIKPKIDQVKEDDNAWNVKDLHKLKPTVSNSAIDAREVLGDELYEFYQGGEFWNDKPEPEKKDMPLDISLEAAIRGKNDKAYEILKEWERTHPDCDRTKFNLGWHEMERGNLLKGHKLMAHGRNEQVFGSLDPGLSTPMWNGERDCTVMMKMEGGFGDQIHGIRYAENLSRDYGCDVIVGGCQNLVDIVKNVPGVTAFCQQEVVAGVYHDYWVPNMSINIPLQTEWSDISGKPYIERIGESEGKIGLKWSGNPKFEHEQHRLFPVDMMWDAVGDLKDNCISLQKEGDVPDWLRTVELEEWRDTVKAISKCDLVISSCTSVAHLAAAMGIETWVVTPLMSYYLWAMPGDKTPHYDSVTLFRQKKYGCWEAPFDKIKTRLQEKYHGRKLLSG